MNKEAEINILRKIMEEVCKNVKQAYFLYDGEQKSAKDLLQREVRWTIFPLPFCMGHMHIISICVSTIL